MKKNRNELSLTANLHFIIIFLAYVVYIFNLDMISEVISENLLLPWRNRGIKAM